MQFSAIFPRKTDPFWLGFANKSVQMFLTLIEKAINAIKRRKEIKPYKVKTPIEFKTEFTKPIIVERCLLYPGVKKIDETIVTYKSNDFLEVFNFRQFQALVNWF